MLMEAESLRWLLPKSKPFVAAWIVDKMVGCHLVPLEVVHKGDKGIIPSQTYTTQVQCSYGEGDSFSPQQSATRHARVRQEQRRDRPTILQGLL